MPLYEPILADGVRDISPMEARVRRFVQRQTEAQFELFGFEPMQTPVLERLATLRGQYGVAEERQVVRLHGAADEAGGEALRFDLTVPLARFVAREWRNLRLPFRRYQFGPVFRTQATTNSRGFGYSRELWQADADVVGTESRVADAELVALGHAIVRAVGLAEARLTLNHRSLLRGLQSLLGVPQASTFIRLMQVLNRLPTESESTIREQLRRDCELNDGQIERLFATLTLPEAPIREQLEEARRRLGVSELANHGVDELLEIVDGLEALDVPPTALRLDLFTTRTFDHYTGVVFKTEVPGLPGLGSVLSGGRSNDLVANFLGTVVPIVGLSVRIDRIADVLMRRKGSADAQFSATRVVILAEQGGDTRAALRLATRLRAEGIACEVNLAAGPVAQHAKRAEALGVPFLATPVAGDAERLYLQSVLDLAGTELSVQQVIDALRPARSADVDKDETHLIFESIAYDTEGLPLRETSDSSDGETDDGPSPEDVRP